MTKKNIIDEDNMDFNEQNMRNYIKTALVNFSEIIRSYQDLLTHTEKLINSITPKTKNIKFNVFEVYHNCYVMALYAESTLKVNTKILKSKTFTLNDFVKLSNKLQLLYGKRTEH